MHVSGVDGAVRAIADACEQGHPYGEHNGGEQQRDETNEGSGHYATSPGRRGTEPPPDKGGDSDDEREPEIARTRPDVSRRERGDGREAENGEPDHAPGPVAMLLQLDSGDRVFGPILGNHEPRRDVEQDAGAAGERERDEGDAVDCRTQVEVGAEAGSDAAKPAVLPRTRQATRLGADCSRFHFSSP